MSSPSDRVLGTPPTNTPADATLQCPADSAHALETGLARQQRERETALKRLAKLRHEAFAEIERLLTFLDAIDPYVQHELEDQVDDGPCDDTELEPSLCGVTVSGGSSEDLELDASDDEPSLGSLEHADQSRWAVGARSDLEEEHDGL